MNLHDVTWSQLWREIVIRFGLTVLRPYLRHSVRATNGSDLTIYVVVCEDEDTYRRNFNLVRRYHMDERHPHEAIQ